MSAAQGRFASPDPMIIDEARLLDPQQSNMYAYVRDNPLRFTDPQTSLRFSERPGQPLAIDSMTGFVSHVEFSDGTVWVPNRASLNHPRLLRLMAPSPEEQRLTELHRKKGLGALVEELKKF